jgi:isoleucyl-tRNA synthetase
LRVKALAEEFTAPYTVPDDLLAAAGEGHALAVDDAGYAVAIDTRLTNDLRDEGLARELVHRIQNLRKAAGLEISDRIVTHHSGWDHVRDVFAAHGAYIREETLSADVVEGPPPEGVTTESTKIDGHEVTLAVTRA